jgi:methionyl-tRNA synthetase|tara:strand:+ start:154 stop:366 length:213 start_codon:yes stop_codon:yes gene_type:complete
MTSEDEESLRQKLAMGIEIVSKLIQEELEEITRYIRRNELTKAVDALFNLIKELNNINQMQWQRSLKDLT